MNIDFEWEDLWSGKDPDSIWYRSRMREAIDDAYVFLDRYDTNPDEDDDIDARIAFVESEFHGPLLGKVSFRDDGRFIWNARGWDALIFKIFDGPGEVPIDLAAWCPAQARVGSRLGIAWAVGQHNAARARFAQEPLIVYANALDYYRAGGGGIVILDAVQAPYEMSGLTLETLDNPDTRDRLQRLAVRKPLFRVL